MGNCGSKPPVEKDEIDQPFPKGASGAQTPKENAKPAKDISPAVPISADEDTTVEPVLTISLQPHLPPLGLTINTTMSREGSRPGTPRSTVAGTPRVVPIACTPRGMLPTSPRMSITSANQDPNAPSFVVAPTVARAKAVSVMTVLPKTSLVRQNSDSSESFEALMPVFGDTDDSAAEQTRVAKADTPSVDAIATASTGNASTNIRDADNAMSGDKGEATAAVQSEVRVTSQHAEDIEEDEVSEEDIVQDVYEDEDVTVEEEDVAYINGDEEEEGIVEVNEEDDVRGDDVGAYDVVVPSGRALTAEHPDSTANVTYANTDSGSVHGVDLAATYLPTAEDAVLGKPIAEYLSSSAMHAYADDDVDEQSPLAVAIPPASPLSVLDCVVLSPEEQVRLTQQVMEEARNGDGVMLQRTVSGGVVSLEARAIPSPRNAFLNGQNSGDLVEVGCVRAARMQAQHNQQYQQYQQQQLQQHYQQDKVGLCGVREEEDEEEEYAHDCTTTVVAPRAPSILTAGAFTDGSLAPTHTSAPTDSYASTPASAPADSPTLTLPSQPVLIADGLWEAPYDGYVEDFVFVSVRVDVCGAAGAMITLYEDEGFDTVAEEVEDEEYELEEDEDVEYEYEEDEDNEVELVDIEEEVEVREMVEENEVEQQEWASAADEAMAMAVATTALTEQGIDTATGTNTAEALDAVPADDVAADVAADTDAHAATVAHDIDVAVAVMVVMAVDDDGHVAVRVCVGDTGTSGVPADTDMNTAATTTGAITAVDVATDADVDAAAGAEGEASVFVAALVQAIIATAVAKAAPTVSADATAVNSAGIDVIATTDADIVAADASACVEVAEEKEQEKGIVPEVHVVVEAAPVLLAISVSADGAPLVSLRLCTATDATDDCATVCPTGATVTVDVETDAAAAATTAETVVLADIPTVDADAVDAVDAADATTSVIDAVAAPDVAANNIEEESKTEEQGTSTSVDPEPSATDGAAAACLRPADAPIVSAAGLPVLGVDTDGMDAAEAALLTRLRSQRRRSSLQMMLEAEEAYKREQEEKTRARMRELNEQLVVSPRSVRSYEILAFAPPTIASPRAGAVTPRGDATPIAEPQAPPSRDECNFPSLGRSAQGEGEEVDAKDKHKKGGKKTKFIKLR